MQACKAIAIMMMIIIYNCSRPSSAQSPHWVLILFSVKLRVLDGLMVPTSLSSPLLLSLLSSPIVYSCLRAFALTLPSAWNAVWLRLIPWLSSGLYQILIPGHRPLPHGPISALFLFGVLIR